MKIRDMIFYLLNIWAWITLVVLIWVSLPSGDINISFNLFNEIWYEFIIINLALGFIIVYVTLELIKYYKEGKFIKEKKLE